MIRWLYNHYALTAAICFYYLALVGYGTYQVFTDISVITGSVVSAYGILMGLPAIVSGLIKWRLSKDNEMDN